MRYTENIFNEANMSERMKAIRQSKGMSLADVGNQLGVSRQRVSAIEAKPMRTQIKTLVSMANIYECRVADFFVE